MKIIPVNIMISVGLNREFSDVNLKKKKFNKIILGNHLTDDDRFSHSFHCHVQ